MAAATVTPEVEGRGQALAQDAAADKRRQPQDDGMVAQSCAG